MFLKSLFVDMSLLLDFCPKCGRVLLSRVFGRHSSMNKVVVFGAAKTGKNYLLQSAFSSRLPWAMASLCSAEVLGAKPAFTTVNDLVKACQWPVSTKYYDATLEFWLVDPKVTCLRVPCLR